MFFGYCDEYVLDMLTDFRVEADVVSLELPSVVEIVEHTHFDYILVHRHLSLF